MARADVEAVVRLAASDRAEIIDGAVVALGHPHAELAVHRRAVGRRAVGFRGGLRDRHLPLAGPVLVHPLAGDLVESPLLDRI